MNSLNKTFLPTKSYKNRNWFIIDCKGQTLGRLSTIIVKLLKGKIKPQYYPGTDIGDYVILINFFSVADCCISTFFWSQTTIKPNNFWPRRRIASFTVKRHFH